MSKKNNDPVFKLFANDFRIDMFFKPSMVGIDDKYILILDSNIRISAKLFDNNIVVIHDIEPMNDSYLSKFYDKFIQFLKNQTSFTILISKLGCNRCIDPACTSNDVPIVEDSRFLTVPQRLYDIMSAKFTGDVHKYGVYVLAVADNFKQVETKEIGTVTGIDVFKTLLFNLNIAKEVKDYSLIPDSYMFDYHGIEVVFKLNNDAIDIIQFTEGQNTTSVIFIELFELFEKMTNDISINVVNVTNYIVNHVCIARQYEKIKDYYKTSRNTLGTYKISPLGDYRSQH